MDRCRRKKLNYDNLLARDTQGSSAVFVKDRLDMRNLASRWAVFAARDSGLYLICPLKMYKNGYGSF